MDEMKAGPELDARLCKLLVIEPVIPVSTDWAAMGKAAEYLDDLDFSLKMEWDPSEEHAYMELKHWLPGAVVYPIYCSPGSDIPHAFALALCEALDYMEAGHEHS